MYFRSWSVEDPGAVTPTLADQISDRMNLAGRLDAHHPYQTWIAIKQSRHHESLALGAGANGVFVKAGDHIDRAAHQRCQCFGTAAQIGNVDSQSFLSEVTETIGRSAADKLIESYRSS